MTIALIKSQWRVWGSADRLAIALLGLTIGYSDHTLGTWACLAATALGARVLEKHFTLDKHESGFRDHTLSAEPAEMAEMVKNVRAIETALGERGKPIAESERNNRLTMRRSLAARRDIVAGETLTADVLTGLRPAHGVPAEKLDAVLGRRTNRAIWTGELIDEELLWDE